MEISIEIFYLFTGGMQDYNYVYAGCMEITLDLSCCKYPNENELEQFWHENKNPLIVYLQKVHMGKK